MNEEKTLWKGPSSVVVILGVFLVCVLAFWLDVALLVVFWGAGSAVRILLLCLLVVPVAIALWKYVQNRCRSYEVTNQRIKVTQGVLSVRCDELELYRVKDITVEQPFNFRLFGAANIVLTTNDSTTPTLVLEAVSGSAAVREELRNAVEACRDQKKVRLAELE